ncbi:Phosphatidylinositol-glycan biosynthesis class W protein [Halotydeus destructor]|nr:Phosphatidylinositol-glycan biosynthesis class W protein [Halotydeus destructor]
MDVAYKNSHEQFIVNLNGTSPWEVASLTTLIPFAHFALLVLITISPALPTRGSLRAAIEALVLFVPFLLGVTCLANASIVISLNHLVGLGLLVASLIILLTNKRALDQLKWTEILFIPRRDHAETNEVLSNLHCNLMISVIISIIAVDFDCFPRRLAKTEHSGWSMMDIGVAGFVAVNGLVSHEARRVKPANNYEQLIKTIKSSIAIVLIGFQRLIAVKSTNYHEHVSEYGVHWNFFFTLAFTKVISTAIICQLGSNCKPYKFSIVIAICHQIVLSLGTDSLVHSDERSNLIYANKEGLLSLPGYVSLYLIFVDIGRHIFRHRTGRRNVDHLALALEMAAVTVMSLVVTYLSHNFIGPVSRREMNLSYLSWVFGLTTFLIALESLLQLLNQSLKFLGLMKQTAKSVLFPAIQFNSLFIFLIANILTGLINFGVNTIHMNTIGSVVTLTLYSLAISILSEHLFRIRFKAVTLPKTIYHKMTKK